MLTKWHPPRCPNMCTCVSFVLSPLTSALCCYRTGRDLRRDDKTDRLPSLPTNLQSHNCPLSGILKTDTHVVDRFSLNLILPRPSLLLSFTMLSFPALSCYSSCCWVPVTQILCLIPAIIMNSPLLPSWIPAHPTTELRHNDHFPISAYLLEQCIHQLIQCWSCRRGHRCGWRGVWSASGRCWLHYRW